MPLWCLSRRPDDHGLAPRRRDLVVADEARRGRNRRRTRIRALSLSSPLVANPFNPFSWFVCVPQAQDFNPVCTALMLELLAPAGRVVCAGDTQQMIYGFRARRHIPSHFQLYVFPNPFFSPTRAPPPAGSPRCVRCFPRGRGPAAAVGQLAVPARSRRRRARPHSPQRRPAPHRAAAGRAERRADFRRDAGIAPASIIWR